MGMNCTTWSEKIYDYCYEILEGEELLEFQQHLASCGQCQQWLVRTRKGLCLLQQWQPEMVSDSLLAKTMYRVSLTRKRIWWIAPWSAAAAVFMLCLSVSLVWLLNLSPSNSDWDKTRPVLAPGNKPRQEAPLQKDTPLLMEKEEDAARSLKTKSAEPHARIVPAAPLMQAGADHSAPPSPAKEDVSQVAECKHDDMVHNAFASGAERRDSTTARNALAAQPGNEKKQETAMSGKLKAKAEQDTPPAMLQRLLVAARAKDEKALRRYIYPLATPQKNWQQEIIHHILHAGAQAIESLAYSETALVELISRYAEQFVPISKEFRQQLGKGEKFWGDAKLIALANSEACNFVIFQQSQVMVLMVQLDGEYRLVWWENIERLK
jgi:hypothetical protein